MTFKVTFDRFYIVIYLTIDVYLDAAEVKVFKVERIATIGSVESFVVNHCNDDSARNLSRKQTFVYVISHAGADAVTFTDDASDGILGIPDFKRFSLFDKYGRRNVHLANQQFTFVYLDAKVRVSSVRHQTKGVLRTHESKLHSDVCRQVSILK